MDQALSASIFRNNVLENILYNASNLGEKGLPNSEEGLLFPMAKAVVNFLGGDLNNIPGSGSSWFRTGGWAHRMNSEIEKCLRENHDRIGLHLANALRDLLHVEWKLDMGSAIPQSGLVWYFTFNPKPAGPVFYISPKDVASIQCYSDYFAPSNIAYICREMGMNMVFFLWIY